MNKILITFLVLLLFASCEKENKGELFSNGQADKVSFYTKSGNWDLSNATYKVSVGRTASESEFTAPIKITAKDNSYIKVFSITSPAKFMAGSDNAELTIGFSDLSTINPSDLAIIPNGMDVNVGLSFPIALEIDEKSIAYANISKYNIATSNTLEFEDLGTVKLDSKAGWSGEESSPKIQKAKGVRAYKLVQPFGKNSIAFMIMSDNKVVCPNQAIDVDSAYGTVSITNVKGTYDEANKKVTLTVGSYAVSAGSFGNGVEIIYLP